MSKDDKKAAKAASKLKKGGGTGWEKEEAGAEAVDEAPPPVEAPPLAGKRAAKKAEKAAKTAAREDGKITKGEEKAAKAAAKTAEKVAKKGGSNDEGAPRLSETRESVDAPDFEDTPPLQPTPVASEVNGTVPPLFRTADKSDAKFTYKCGMLTKRGGSDTGDKTGKSSKVGKKVDIRQRKKDNWFEYRERNLDWWDSRADAQGGKKNRRGRLSIADCQRVWGDSDKKNFRFQIQTAEKTLQLYTQTEQDQYEWVRTLTEAIEDYQLELNRRRGRHELKTLFESEVIGASRTEFAKLIQTFNGAIEKLRITYAALGDRGEYAEDADSLAFLRSFVPASVGVVKNIREDMAELDAKLDLLTMGHDEEEMQAVRLVQRKFRAVQSRRQVRARRNAIVKLQAWVRGSRRRLLWRAQCSAAVVFQRFWRGRTRAQQLRMVRRIQAVYRRFRLRKLIGLTVGAQYSSTDMWNNLLDSSLAALFYCSLCGCPLEHCAPRRQCGVCLFVEDAPFQLQRRAPTARGTYSGVSKEQAAQLVDLAATAVTNCANAMEATKNALYFFLSQGMSDPKFAADLMKRCQPSGALASGDNT
jgi:hypothetical protein